MAFESLTERLSGIFKKIRGQARLTEANMEDMLKEIRVALLEADVNYKVVKEFTNNVKEKALGTVGNERQAVQGRPAETSRETESRAKADPPDERTAGRPADGKNALPHRMLRQLQYQRHQCRGRMRGVQRHETKQKGLPQV